MLIIIPLRRLLGSLAVSGEDYVLEQEPNETLVPGNYLCFPLDQMVELEVDENEECLKEFKRNTSDTVRKIYNEVNTDGQ